MEQALKWMRDHVVDGETWVKVMIEALPAEADQQSAPAAAPAPAAAVPAAETAIDIGHPDLELVVDGKMDLREFTEWMKLVTSKFEPRIYKLVVRQLMAFLTKEQQATRLFKAWDDDNSGSLDTSELKKILEHFKEQFKAADAEFTLMEDMVREKESEAGGFAPAWTSNVVASLDAMAAQRSVDLPAFKVWLMQVAGHLSPETFDKAMAELTEIIEKAVSTKLLFRVWDSDSSGSLDFAEVSRPHPTYTFPPHTFN